MVLKTDVQVNVPRIVKKTQDILEDEVLLLQIHNLFAKMCDPYVPMDSGTLAQSIEVTKDSVVYKTPYAHYMYEGEVFGDNIPIKDKDTGEIIGWFSRPGVKKHPTGRQISYGTSPHPKATKQWDKVMLSEKRDEFVKQVEELIKRRVQQLYG